MRQVFEAQLELQLPVRRGEMTLTSGCADAPLCAECWHVPGRRAALPLPKWHMQAALKALVQGVWQVRKLENKRTKQYKTKHPKGKERVRLARH